MLSQVPTQPPPPGGGQLAPNAKMVRLQEVGQMLDADLITQQDYDKQRAAIVGTV